MIPVILLTWGEMQNFKQENHDFTFCLLLLVHSGWFRSNQFSSYGLFCLACVIFSSIATALFCRHTNALLTTITILLLSAYTGIHFYIRFLFNERDFTIVTLRLGFVLILLILFVPWTNIMVYSYQMKFQKETICSREVTLSWLLNLDTILVISLLTLNFRIKVDLNQHQLITFAIGLALIGLWLSLGKILIKKSRHWIVWISFYMLSILHMICLAYTTYWVS
ncbi:unnamed protein product [Adineta ricciae]|uniref:Uncharacterized protein n=1 Tax=Adineta ricciae TaxID=249248 RepID=A0A814GM37_ADIRI|nr:unnamed protein product [Adineta ricciae]